LRSNVKRLLWLALATGLLLLPYAVAYADPLSCGSC